MQDVAEAVRQGVREGHAAVVGRVIDVKGYRRWAFPLVVVGLNSIAAYLIAHLWEDFLRESLLTNLGHAPFAILGPGLQPLLLGATILLLDWLLLHWMYRRKIFLRI